MELNTKQEERYRIQLKELCKRYCGCSNDRGVTFGVLFSFLKRKKIIISSSKAIKQKTEKA